MEHVHKSFVVLILYRLHLIVCGYVERLPETLRQIKEIEHENEHIPDFDKITVVYINNEELNDFNEQEVKEYNVDIDDSESLDDGVPHYRRKKWFYTNREKKIDKQLKEQQQIKLDTIMKFLKTRYQSTNYIYEEILRINAQRVVKDPLRKMVEYLEDPSRKNMKDLMLEAFKNLLEQQKTKKKSIWDYKTNNLILNVLTDPYNDGVIN